MEQSREIDIDLRKIFFMMRKWVIFIILITVAVGVLAGCYTEFLIKPTYLSSITLYVYSNPDRISTDGSISYNEISASQALVDTYMELITRDSILENVIEDLKLNTTSSAIRSQISTSRVGETLIFELSVRDTDPQRAMDIANSIAKVAPDEIIRITQSGGIQVVDEAKKASSPSSPNMNRNIIIGALTGFLVSFVAFFIKEAFNTTITNVKDIEREFEIPVLGTIPRLASAPVNQPKDSEPDADKATKGAD